jgi:hypothetical protein
MPRRVCNWWRWLRLSGSRPPSKHNPCQSGSERHATIFCTSCYVLADCGLCRQFTEQPERRRWPRCHSCGGSARGQSMPHNARSELYVCPVRDFICGVWLSYVACGHRCTDNQLQDDDAVRIGRMLERNTTLRHLRLTGACLFACLDFVTARQLMLAAVCQVTR